MARSTRVVTAVDGLVASPKNQTNPTYRSARCVNRYPRRLKRIEPFVDNTKLIEDLLPTMARLHPLRVFGIPIRPWRLLLRGAQSRQLPRDSPAPSSSVPGSARTCCGHAAICVLRARALLVFGAEGLVFRRRAGFPCDAFPRQLPAVGAGGRFSVADAITSTGQGSVTLPRA